MNICILDLMNKYAYLIDEYLRIKLNEYLRIELNEYLRIKLKNTSVLN